MKAGFAAVDVTPPLGTCVAGWIKFVEGTEVLDPIYARASVIESDGTQLGMLQIDGTRAPWYVVTRVREAIEKKYGVPGANLMIAATHNHASGNINESYNLQADEKYRATVIEGLVSAFGQAMEQRREVEWGCASVKEFRFAFNRRVKMRDGTVKTHGQFSDPDALCFEGPIDPEVAVVAFREKAGGNIVGTWVNYACHPTDHGSQGKFSAGWPGAMARELNDAGVPNAMFLNGAAGNIATPNPIRDGKREAPDDIGRWLAEDVQAAIEKIEWRAEAKLDTRARTVELPFQKPSAEQIAGTSRGTQRFIDPKLYDNAIPKVLKEIEARGGSIPAQVQVFDLDEWSLAAIPAEYFVELGLDIKERAHPRKALVVGYANGMLAYVPHRACYERGGYETTFPGCRVAPGAGETLADTAVALIGQTQR